MLLRSITLFAVNAATTIAATVASPLAHATGPTADAACTDKNKIVASDTGDMVCSTTSTSPSVLQWQPLGRPLETVIMGSVCGQKDTWGDFRTARSTDDYLLWCVGKGKGSYPMWVLNQS